MKDALGWQLQLKKENASTRLSKANPFCNPCHIKVLPSTHQDVSVYFCTSVLEITFCQQIQAWHKHMFICTPFFVAKLERFLNPKVQHDCLMWQMLEQEWADLTDVELSALCYDWDWNYSCCEERTRADFWLMCFVCVCVYLGMGTTLCISTYANIYVCEYKTCSFSKLMTDLCVINR